MIAAPWDRGRPGRTPAREEGRDAGTAEAHDVQTKGGRDGRAPRGEGGMLAAGRLD